MSLGRIKGAIYRGKRGMTGFVRVRVCQRDDKGRKGGHACRVEHVGAEEDVLWGMSDV